MRRLRSVPGAPGAPVALAALAALVAPVALCPLGLSSPAAAAVVDGSEAAAVASAAFALESAAAFSAAEQALLAAALDEAFAASPSVGLSVGVLHGERAWTAARGLARLEPPLAATPRTTYRMASVTKTFTAIAAMKLVEEGKLGLDDEVQRYLPAFPKKPWPVTVRQLLNHTSGIGHYRNRYDATSTTPVKVTEALQIFQGRELLVEPGSRFLYTTFGYNVLGAIIEKAGGRPFGEVLAGLWTPLGMTRTSLEHGLDERGPEDAFGYRLAGDPTSPALVPSERIDISARFGGGGARSTVEDMLRWARALLDGALVSPATWQAMTTPTVTADGRQADYGLGFAVYPQRGLNVVAHAGGQAETSTLLLLVPERRFAVALATNLEGDARRLSALAERFTEIVLEAGRRRPDLVAASEADDVIYDGLVRFFSWGIARRKAPRANAQVDDAFGRLAGLFANDVIAADPEAARARLHEAYHPAFGRLSPLVGGEMASRLERAHGSAALEKLRLAGPLAFFQAYIDLCARTRCPPARSLPTGLVDAVKRLQAPGALQPRPPRETLSTTAQAGPTPAPATTTPAPP